MEKKSEYSLSKLLENFEQNYSSYIYYSLSNTVLSKYICGIPDRVIYKKGLLIIIECKSEKVGINKAKIQLKKYGSNIDKLKSELECKEIYFIAFVSDTNYIIYNEDFREIEITISKLLEKYYQENLSHDINLNLNNCYNLRKTTMEKSIHSIHNYIRDNTKISNEDKPFFIAIILIALKKPSFREIMENYDSKKYVFDLLQESLKDFDIDISSFYFLKTDKNNTHFLSIINMVKKTVDFQGNKGDLINVFYREFVRYYNTDSKSLGIVLTPHHIVKIMNKLLEINDSDIILDFCSGTGSFVLQAEKYKPRKIIACEYQQKLFTLLHCNMILREICKEKYDIHKEDCFNIEFNATKSIINPPYGIKTHREIDFVYKQLESIEEGGLACSIIPISNIKNHCEKREEITKISKVLTIIKCSDKLFYPTAGVSTCILLLKKDKHGHSSDDLVKIIDYSNDGFEIKRGKGLIRGENYSACKKKLYNDLKNEDFLHEISLKGDWLETGENVVMDISRIELQKKLLEIEYHTAIINLMNRENEIMNEIVNEKIPVFKNIKISKLFSIMKKPVEPYVENFEFSEKINLVSAKNNNNGVKGIGDSDSSTFSGNNIVLITSGDGGAGLAYYQETPFKISSATIVLVPNEDFILDKYTGIYIAMELCKYKKVYSRGYTWSIEKIKNDTINIPWKKGKIDKEYIKSLFSLNFL